MLTPSLALAIVAVACLWACVCGWWVLRTWGYVVVATIASLVMLIGAVSGSAAWRAPVLAASLGACAAILGPVRSRLGAVTATDIEADLVLRRISTVLDDRASPPTALAFVTDLQAPPFTTPGSPWRTVGRLMRRIVDLIEEPQPDPVPEALTPLWAYRRAARDYWSLVLNRRVIGRSHTPSAWDEDLVLRCTLDEFAKLSAISAQKHDLEELREGRYIEQEHLIAEVSALPLRHPTSLKNRELVVRAMRMQLVAGGTDRSHETGEERKTATAAILESWARVGPP